MNAAAWPRACSDDERLLVIDPQRDDFEDSRLGELGRWVRAGDLVIVNDAATLPASLHARTETGDELELRLMGGGDDTWVALAFGAGDFRIRTEDRPAPPHLTEGGTLMIGDELRARVVGAEGRMLTLRFDRAGAAFWRAIYAHGRPIQYAHVREPLSLWHVQTRFASRPWAFEMPSAGRPLSWELLHALVRGGAELERVTHAAGISSTGSDDLDRRLPLVERSEVPAETVAAITRTRQRSGRVIAVGTTVVRALESRAATGELTAGAGDAALVIGPGFRPRVVNALLTGMHPPGTPHFAVTEAFAPRQLLERALSHAERAGYLEHEFGDSCLVLPESL